MVNPLRLIITWCHQQAIARVDNDSERTNRDELIYPRLEHTDSLSRVRTISFVSSDTTKNYEWYDKWWSSIDFGSVISNERNFQSRKSLYDIKMRTIQRFKIWLIIKIQAHKVSWISFFGSCQIFSGSVFVRLHAWEVRKVQDGD